MCLLVGGISLLLLWELWVRDACMSVFLDDHQFAAYQEYKRKIKEDGDADDLPR